MFTISISYKISHGLLQVVVDLEEVVDAVIGHHVVSWLPKPLETTCFIPGQTIQFFCIKCVAPNITVLVPRAHWQRGVIVIDFTLTFAFAISPNNVVKAIVYGLLEGGKRCG